MRFFLYESWDVDALMRFDDAAYRCTMQHLRAVVCNVGAVVSNFGAVVCNVGAVCVMLVK